MIPSLAAAQMVHPLLSGQPPAGLLPHAGLGTWNAGLPVPPYAYGGYGPGPCFPGQGLPGPGLPMHWPGLDSKAAAAMAVSAGLPMHPAMQMHDPNAIRLNQKAIEAMRQQAISSEGMPSCVQDGSNLQSTKRSNMDTMSHLMPAESSGRSVQELRSPSQSGASALAKAAAAAAAAAGMWPGEWPPQSVPGMSADDVMRLLHASRATEVLQRLPTQWGPVLSGSQVSSGHRPSRQQQQQQLPSSTISQDMHQQQQHSLPGPELPAAQQLLAALQSKQGSVLEPGASVSIACNSGSAAPQLEHQKQKQQRQQQQQSSGMPPPHPHPPQQQQQSSRHTASANGHRSSNSAAAAAIAAAVPRGSSSSSIHVTPEEMRARLGNRRYYMIRAMLLQQQETFMQQVFELHWLHRAQQHLSAEVNSPEYQLTAQFAKEAAAVMRSVAAGATGSPSASPPAAAANGDARKSPVARSNSGGIERPRTPQITKATAEEVAADDGGAAAVALLSVHVALMPQVPSAMRRVVPQPTDFRGMEPSRYQVRRDAPGVKCPVPSRFVPRNSSGVAGPAISGDTVEVGPGGKKSVLGKWGAPGVTSRGQPGAKRQQEWEGVNGMVGAGAPAEGRYGKPLAKVGSAAKLAQSGGARAVSEKAPSFGAGRQCGSDDVQVQLSGSDEQLGQQQDQDEEQQSKDLGGSELQGQVSSGAAAAAAAMSGPFAAAAAAMAGAAGAVAAAAAVVGAVPPRITPPMGAPLNVFRPNPQISPSVASRFLAGDPLHNRGFDPHSYWMKKHYGGGAQQQQQQQGPAISQGDKQQEQQQQQQQKQQQLEQQANGSMDRVAPAPAAAAAESLQTGDVPAAPKVVQWWQNAEATFGEPGLIDPTKPNRLLDADTECQKSASKHRRSTTTYNSLPHKKRVKHMGSMEEGYDHSAMDSQPNVTDMPAPRAVVPGSRSNHDAGHGHVEGGRGFGTKDRLDSAFRRVAHRPPTRQRSKVRSNRSGSRTLDTLATSIASEGAESGSSGEHRHNRGGMSSPWGASVCRGGRGGGSSAAGGGHKSVTLGSELWSGVGGHSTAKSAAGILLSMSGSMEQGS